MFVSFIVLSTVVCSIRSRFLVRCSTYNFFEQFLPTICFKFQAIIHIFYIGLFDCGFFFRDWPFFIDRKISFQSIVIGRFLFLALSHLQCVCTPNTECMFCKYLISSCTNKYFSMTINKTNIFDGSSWVLGK